MLREPAGREHDDDPGEALVGSGCTGRTERAIRSNSPTPTPWRSASPLYATLRSRSVIRAWDRGTPRLSTHRHDQRAPNVTGHGRSAQAQDVNRGRAATHQTLPRSLMEARRRCSPGAFTHGAQDLRTLRSRSNHSTIHRNKLRYHASETHLSQNRAPPLLAGRKRTPYVML